MIDADTPALPPEVARHRRWAIWFFALAVFAVAAIVVMRLAVGADNWLDGPLGYLVILFSGCSWHHAGWVAGYRARDRGVDHV